MLSVLLLVATAFFEPIAGSGRQQSDETLAQRRNLPDGYSRSFYNAGSTEANGASTARRMATIMGKQLESKTDRATNAAEALTPAGPPVLPKQGAVASGVYRNMFTEYGFTAEVQLARSRSFFEWRLLLLPPFLFFFFSFLPSFLRFDLRLRTWMRCSCRLLKLGWRL